MLVQAQSAVQPVVAVPSSSASASQALLTVLSMLRLLTGRPRSCQPSTHSRSRPVSGVKRPSQLPPCCRRSPCRWQVVFSAASTCQQDAEAPPHPVPCGQAGLCGRWGCWERLHFALSGSRPSEGERKWPRCCHAGCPARHDLLNDRAPGPLTRHGCSLAAQGAWLAHRQGRRGLGQGGEGAAGSRRQQPAALAR